jgi:hypothetical protein
MPAFTDLSDEQVNASGSYVRTLQCVQAWHISVTSHSIRLAWCLRTWGIFARSTDVPVDAAHVRHRPRTHSSQAVDRRPCHVRDPSLDLLRSVFDYLEA